MAIPVVDLSPFFLDGNEDGRKKCRDIISKAASDHGNFQIANHRVPLDLMSRAMEVSKSFFDSTVQEKLDLNARWDTPHPAGYHSQSPKKENFYVCSPGTSYSVFPDHPPEYKEIMEELFTYFAKTSQLVESIINDCLGLPPNFLTEYNNDRSVDLMVALRYFPALENGSFGVYEHQDPNVLTLVLQDDTGGLQVRLDDGERIPVTPIEGALLVNVSDIIEVLSNGKFKSGIHRVMSPEGRNRHSFAFFYYLDWKKWVEPLPEFTTRINAAPKYRGFLHQDYQDLKRQAKIDQKKPEDKKGLAHYAIPNANFEGHSSRVLS